MNNVPLRLVLIIPFVLQTGCAVGLTAWLSLRNGQKAVNEVAERLQEEISQRIEERLLAYLAIPQSVNALNARAIALDGFDRDRALERQMWQHLQVFPTLTANYFASTEGHYISAKRQIEGGFSSGIRNPDRDIVTRRYNLDNRGDRARLDRLFPDFDPRQRPWYETAVRARGRAWSPIYPDYTAEDLAITAVLPLYDGRGRLQGVIGTDILFTGFREFLGKMEIGKSGMVFAMERSGSLVATSIETPLFLLAEENPSRIRADDSPNDLIRSLARHLQEQLGDLYNLQTAQQFNFTFKGSSQFVQVTPLQDDAGLDWLIVVAIPESDFLGQIQAHTRQTITWCFLALAFSSGAGILTARWISRPILKLASASQQLTQLSDSEILAFGDRDLVFSVAT